MQKQSAAAQRTCEDWEVISVPNLTSAANCICPFYLGETSQSISCEGMIDGVRARNVFPTAEAKGAYMQTRCYSHAYARRCWHAAALVDKAEGG